MKIEPEKSEMKTLQLPSVRAFVIFGLILNGKFTKKNNRKKKKQQKWEIYILFFEIYIFIDDGRDFLKCQIIYIFLRKFLRNF